MSELQNGVYICDENTHILTISNKELIFQVDNKEILKIHNHPICIESGRYMIYDFGEHLIRFDSNNSDSILFGELKYKGSVDVNNLKWMCKLRKKS